MTAQKTNASDTFTSQASASGWRASADLPSGVCEAVPVWVYSHSFHTGSRLIAQLLKDIYDNGLPADYVEAHPGKPGDVLNAELNTYDGLPANLREQAHQSLTGGMVHYSRSTKLWAMLPHYSQTPGVHLVIVDWHAANAHVIQQGVCLQADPLSPQQIADISKQVISAHVARHPYDKPISRRSH